ncbi:hypothetical protein HOI18_04485 [Candidatus Uhrbacteria bacterium]|jgi:hypothetical protein|nr:hypothetical protein [Candidatus Uhrbacteria bacterium]
MKNTVPKIWIFFFFAVIAVLIGIYMTAPESPQNGLGESSEALIQSARTQTFENMLALGEDAIYLENQLADSQSLAVGYVILSQPGFVVIYADDQGVPGEVIGVSQLLESGAEHLEITLQAYLSNDEIYYAILHHDNGDDEFSSVHDNSATDSEDSVVLMTFTALEDIYPEIAPVAQ